MKLIELVDINHSLCGILQFFSIKAALSIGYLYHHQLCSYVIEVSEIKTLLILLGIPVELVRSLFTSDTRALPFRDKNSDD